MIKNQEETTLWKIVIMIKSKIKEVFWVVLLITAGIAFPLISAIFIGNHVALIFGWGENTYGALISRAVLAIIFIAISTSAIYNSTEDKRTIDVQKK